MYSRPPYPPNPRGISNKAIYNLVQVPGPHCASCNGTFVEKVRNTQLLAPQRSRLTIPQQIESDADDPRTFQESGPPLDGGGTPGGGPGLDNFFSTPNSMSSYRRPYMYFYRFISTSERSSAPARTSAWKSKPTALSREGKHSMYPYPLAHPILMCCSGRGRSWFPIRHRSRSGRFPDNFTRRATVAWWKSARVRKDVNVIRSTAS